MRLKMGASIVSSKMGKQKFRVRIAPKDERILADHPRLTVLTEPVRVLTDSPPKRQDKTIVRGVVLETHNWVACGRCGKWRRLPLDTPCPARGASWSCAMNPDAAHNSCDAGSIDFWGDQQVERIADVTTRDGERLDAVDGASLSALFQEVGILFVRGSGCRCRCRRWRRLCLRRSR